ncbi:Nn.00g013010.m01.CDS01 [Neocucurbitaria sp. VM-36]
MALVLLAGSATALPWPGQPTTYTPARDLSKLAKLFPQSALPAPNEELKYVLLGIGTQNYTCSTGDETAAPGTTGAVATLYDIGSKLNNDPMAKWKIGSIAPLALALSNAPKTLEMSLKSQGYENIAGHHFFSMMSGTNTPVFSLDKLQLQPQPLAPVSKLNETDAPTSACPGNNGLPAIKWLYLKDTKGASQGGIDTVYRVETAGGNKPATCKGMKPSWEVKYAAQYWVFGPKQ